MANILIADNDETMRGLLLVSLKRTKHDVKMVETGEDAIETIRRFTLDLVILDYSLPDLTAIEILSALKENGDEIPLVMVLSSKSTPDSIRECVEAGARDYVVKPFNLPILIERIQIMLYKSKNA